MEISLQELAGGALQEKVNQAFEKVMQNMQDPNTPYDERRSNDHIGRYGAERGKTHS